MKNNRAWLLSIAGIIFAALIFFDIWSQPKLSDLPGGFEEVAFIRNDQNKGGIVRVYAFTVADTTTADFQACGDFLAHNDYGSITKAFFFLKNQEAPNTLSLVEPHFDHKEFHLIASYIKGENGQVTVKRFR